MLPRPARSGLLPAIAALMLGLLALMPVAACRAEPPARQGAQGGLPVQAARILRELPHDPHAYTEGLFIDGGQLFESTGQVGRSSLRRVDLETGKVLEQAVVPAPLFGEGIAPWHGQILSLTWQDGIGFRWSREGLRQIGHFVYMGEGWALTPVGDELAMSDGTDILRFIDPATFRVKRFLAITAGGRPVTMLNELEYVDGEILANIWLTDRIARIDPRTGHVLGWIDVSALHRKAGAMGEDQVANGIAWDAVHRRLYVTGKEWPVMFEIAPPKGR